MVSESKLTVRYQETDQMGIVHHSVYPIWYEVGRSDFCKKMGFPYSKMEEKGIMTPIYEVHAYYKIPARYDDVLTIQTYVEKLTPYRIEFGYRIYKNDRLIHTGKTVHVWVDAKDFKPLNMKKHHPDLMELLENTIEKGE